MLLAGNDSSVIFVTVVTVAVSFMFRIHFHLCLDLNLVFKDLKRKVNARVLMSHELVACMCVCVCVCLLSVSCQLDIVFGDTVFVNLVN